MSSHPKSNNRRDDCPNTGMVARTAAQVKLRALCVCLLNLELSLSHAGQGKEQANPKWSIGCLTFET
jgi:hypothetical protein